MKELLKVNPAAIGRAVAVLRDGGLVAYPTETYYGLGADPFNQAALDKLYRLKNRDQQLPILVVVAGSMACQRLTEGPLPADFHRLAARFWPGPLTLVCTAHRQLPQTLTGSTGTIGMRHSSHPVAQQLTEAFGGPVTATSANISGLPAATTAQQVAAVFSQGLDLILDGGPTPGLKGSTLIGCGHERLEYLREGVIPFATIDKAMQEDKP
ncbi:L-threonylcarbamoyladenylate synthase [Desulfogranum mediterraneum]|uniref:L-threonylcarbamoyladenylate synthase n=1 Tax=Desulfogranum mediterraneum TaxID=160661 RepID=UPI0004069EFE|nr:L-threonylcarbamoyladenylate synthase [Desulfogranum mediterraneum]